MVNYSLPAKSAHTPLPTQNSLPRHCAAAKYSRLQCCSKVISPGRRGAAPCILSLQCHSNIVSQGQHGAVLRILPRRHRIKMIFLDDAAMSQNTLTQSAVPRTPSSCRNYPAHCPAYFPVAAKYSLPVGAARCARILPRLDKILTASRRSSLCPLSPCMIPDGARRGRGFDGRFWNVDCNCDDREGLLTGVCRFSCCRRCSSIVNPL
mmetsp:Transcript_38305/g.81786  ORF Transcript_38305/g.81786 Transcript_38305/m.81786 type:complete len:207 (+) Transcript_38305:252-872(+)